jgi:hypothetical protein
MLVHTYSALHATGLNYIRVLQLSRDPRVHSTGISLLALPSNRAHPAPSTQRIGPTPPFADPAVSDVEGTSTASTGLRTAGASHPLGRLRAEAEEPRREAHRPEAVRIHDAAPEARC